MVSLLIPAALGVGSLLSSFFSRKSQQNAEKKQAEAIAAANAASSGGGGSAPTISPVQWQSGPGTFAPNTMAGLQMPSSNMSQMLAQYMLRSRNPYSSGQQGGGF